MEEREIVALLALLAAAWPDRSVTRDTVRAYHLAWGDLPYALAERAVGEWLATGRFFPAPAEIRELAVRAGLGLPAAEIAWREAAEAIARYRPGDGPPVWSSRVLEDAVNAVGWGTIKLADADQLGTLRAQFRDTYNALVRQQVAAPDAMPALEAARERRALGELLQASRAERRALGEGERIAVPAPLPAPERYMPYVGQRAVKRFEARKAADRPAAEGRTGDGE